MFDTLLKSVFGSKHDRDIKRVTPIVAEINQHAEALKGLSDEELRAKTAEFRARISSPVEWLSSKPRRRLRK